jgi:hypothetical protein
MMNVKKQVQLGNQYDDELPQQGERRRPPVDKRWQELLNQNEILNY